MKIKTELLFSFFIVFTSILVAFLLFVKIETNIKDTYKADADLRISEYEISDFTKQLSTTYSSLLTNPNDKVLNAQYQSLLNKIDVVFSKLDLLITNSNSAPIYNRIKNRTYLLEENIRRGVESAQVADFSKNAEILEQVNRDRSNIESDISSLIFLELQAALNKQAAADQAESVAITIGSAIIFLVVIGSAVFAVAIANKVINPLERLSKLAEYISKGNTDRVVDVDLIKMKNEIGILSRTLNSMIVNVEEKINTRTVELQQERARLLASINSLSLGFILFNPKNEIILKNRAVEHLLSVNEDQLSLDWINKQLGIHISIDDCRKDRSLCEFKEVDWKNKIFRVLVVPVFIDENNEIIGFVLLIEDITEEKLLDRTKDEFFAIASHELRTPLTAIKGNTEIIKTSLSDTIKSPEVLEMINDIYNESARLIGITNDFLDVSRIEAHKNKLDVVPINLNEVVNSVANELKGLASAKNIAIMFNENKDVSNVLGDKNRVRQIVTNLIANALNNTEKGYVSISLSNEGNFVKTSVLDTGSGIQPENQKLLFRKFQQAGRDIYTRGSEKGIGMGLYISKLLVEDMGGDIWLEETKVGVGSVFSFTLPAVV